MNQIEFDLFDETKEQTTVQSNLSYKENSLLTSLIQKAIYSILITGTSSAREVCEELINNHEVPKDRYPTGKPKIYPLVCIFLDSLVLKGELEFINEDERTDRFYKLHERK